MSLGISSSSDGLSASLLIGGSPAFTINKNGAVSGLSGRQKLINGDFSINQLVVSGTVTLAAGVYGHDMWKAGAGGCTYTFSTTANVTTITISAGTLLQIIEGIWLHSGTHILSWGGTAQARIDTGSYSNSGITGTAVGGTNQSIEFGTGTVILPQYEPGTITTLFEYRMGGDYMLCQKYLPSWISGSTLDALPNACIFSATTAYLTLIFKTPTRIAPTGIGYSNVNIITVSGYTTSAIGLNNSGINGATLTLTSAGMTAGIDSATRFNSIGARLFFTGCQL